MSDNFSKHNIIIRVSYLTYIELCTRRYEPEIEYDYMVIEDSMSNLFNGIYSIQIYFRTDIDKNLFQIKHPEILYVED